MYFVLCCVVLCCVVLCCVVLCCVVLCCVVLCCVVLCCIIGVSDLYSVIGVHKPGCTPCFVHSD